MLIVWGRRFYGKIESLDGACVRTYFFHLFFLPLVPLRSFLLLTGASGDRGLQLRLHGRSTLAAYVRLWPLVTAYVGFALANEVALVPGALLAVGSVALAGWAWLRLGRPSPAERAERQAYAPFVGAPVDVALLVDATHGRDAAPAARWLAEVTAKAEAAFAGDAENPQASYRDAARFAHWRQVAEQPQLVSPRCRRAALTLARIAWAQSAGAARAEAAAAHVRLSAALDPVEPELARAA